MNKSIYSIWVIELHTFILSNGLDKVEYYGKDFATSDINKAFQLAANKTRDCPLYNYMVKERS